MLNKYKNYFEAIFNIPIEQIEQTQGIIIKSEDRKKNKPTGWILKLPVHVFETSENVVISCIPEWEDEIHHLLDATDVAGVIPKMQDRFGRQVFHYFKIFGLDSLNPHIQTTEATLLSNEHFDQYRAFAAKTYPNNLASIQTALQGLEAGGEFTDLISSAMDGLDRLYQKKALLLYEDFKKHVSKQRHYCLIVNDEIVSITESESIPHEPQGIVELGIRTLKEHRRKGYATIVCAAFIEQCLGRGDVPVWSVEFDNAASEGLAEKLGFRHMGNIMYVSELG